MRTIGLNGGRETCGALLALIAGLLLAMSGCGVKTSTYMNPLLATTQISDVFQLPMLTSLLQPSEAEEFDDKVSHNLGVSNPGTRFRKVHETRTLVGRDGSVEKIYYYGNNIAEIDTLPNRAILKELKDSFGIEAILQGEMKILDDKEVRRPTVGPGSRLVWRTLTQSGVSLTYRVYSTKTGLLLWELAVVSKVENDDDPDALDKAIVNARREMLMQLRDARFSP